MKKFLCFTAAALCLAAAHGADSIADGMAYLIFSFIFTLLGAPKYERE